MFKLPAWLPPLPGTESVFQPPPDQRGTSAPRTSGIRVSLADRWAILGMTGTGKTTFARKLTRHLRQMYPHARVYVLDSKAAGDFAGWPGLVTRATPPDVRLAPGAVQVWQPPINDRQAYDVWFNTILDMRQPAIVYVDELSSIGGKRGTDYPIGFQRLQKQGRGLGISLIVLSQEVAGMPRQVLGQATHLVRFRLLTPFDARAADQLLGRKKSIEPRDVHGFFYSRLDEAMRSIAEYDAHHDFF